MPVCFNYLPHEELKIFSSIIRDYLSQSPSLRSFYSYGTDLSAISQAIHDRKSYPVNRALLINVLKDQYQKLEKIEAVEKNIQSLSDERTFTICTAHQPNLMTGYLYFIYKILHAAKLASTLKQSFPDYNFVPVYYMGSEDNDLEELATFRYNKETFIWDGGGQKGAVGRMQTKTLSSLLNQLFRQTGPPGPELDTLKEILTNAYLKHNTIAEATRYLVHRLLGKYGVVVLDPDDRRLKQQFIPIIQDDLYHHTAHKKVQEQISRISQQYKTQAYPRQINLFYLTDNLRERIERTAEGWQVLNTDIRWKEQELNNLLTTSPECFSPNVILRGLFQERILPNIVFIGGGAEVAYWLQLRTIFEHYGIFFPSIHLRQSVQWIDQSSHTLRMQLGLSLTDIFRNENTLLELLVARESGTSWKATAEISAIEEIIQQLKQKATSLDPTLSYASEAVLSKIRHQVQVLEKKMLRAEKRKLQTHLSRLSKLKENLFPGNNLQERTDNFMEYYLRFGDQFFELLYNHMEPLRHEFLVAEEHL